MLTELTEEEEQHGDTDLSRGPSRVGVWVTEFISVMDAEKKPLDIVGKVLGVSSPLPNYS